MLDVNAAILRSLITSTDTDNREEQVVIEQVGGDYVDTTSKKTVNVYGINVPERLYTWFNSSYRREAVRQLFYDSPQSVATVGKDESNNSFYFNIKGDGKSRAYWSRGYRTLDEACDDLLFVFQYLSGRELGYVQLKCEEIKKKYLNSLNDNIAVAYA